jgi:ankyrin repeat domain-containing protein 50
VECLIEFDGWGVDREDIDGWIPLAWALFHCAPKTVQTLLSSGLVNVNKKDLNGKSPLSFAGQHGYLSVVKLFLAMEG